MCPFVSADVRGGGRLRDEPKECLRRRLHQRQIKNQHQHQRQASNENIARLTRFKKNSFNTFLVYVFYFSAVIFLTVSLIYTVGFPKSYFHKNHTSVPQFVFKTKYCTVGEIAIFAQS